MSAGDDVDVEDVAPPPQPNLLSEAALARHAQRMRPLRRIYALVLAVAAVALLAVVIIAYNRGEISHATLHTAPSALPSVALQTPSGQLTKAWSSTDESAVGTPYYDGTVITHDQHTVRGRNALTGKQIWSYTRTDRAMCAAIQNDGVTIAVYQLHGNCDELTALDSSTGQREWDRTLDKDGAVFEGPASYWTQPGNVMLVSKTSIYAIADQNDGGLDWWTFYHPGCTINSAMLGVGGALISQTCRGEKCKGEKFCGDGRQLLLRQAEAGTSDSGTNPDQIVWNLLGSDLQPALAGQHIAGRDPATGDLLLLEPKSGKTQTRLPLAAPQTVTPAPTFTSTLDADLLWADGNTYALKTNATSFAWRASTRYLPTVIKADGTTTASLAGARLAVPATSGIAEISGTTGAVEHSFSTTAPPPASLVYPFGTGFLVAGSTTTMYR